MFIPYGHQSINDDDIRAVAEALRADLITRGPFVLSFEKAIADYVGAAYAVAFPSGSTALAAAYDVKNIGPEDKVITSPNTFIATNAFAARRKAKIAFCDIDRNSGNLDIEKLDPHYESLNGRLFIVPVHFAGIPVDMQKLYEKSLASNIVIIEDAAHALGSSYKDGKKVGCCSYSEMTIFSFHPVKNITTGEGGMVTTNDPELYEKLKLFRNSGIKKDPNSLWDYKVEHFSSNFNFTDFQAALGISQLKRLEIFIEKRRKLMSLYREKLTSPHIRLFDPIYDPYTAYHINVAQIDFKELNVTRDQLMERLKKEGIGTQVHYIPLYRHPCYKMSVEEFFPEMEKYYQSALTLPLYVDMKEEDVARVCSALAIS